MAERAKKDEADDARKANAAWLVTDQMCSDIEPRCGGVRNSQAT